MKLTLQKVRWRNFLATGDAWLEINLAKDLTTLIVGKNGDGKSTFMDAITFALFNTAFRKINKNQLVNSINKKGLLVEIEFTTPKSHYIVRRGIKPTIFEIYQDGTLINQNADSRDYQKVLENEILRLNYRTFIQTVVVGSATYVPFMQLVSNHRREVIEDLVDIQMFTKMNVLLKGLVQQNKEASEKISHQVALKAVAIEANAKHRQAMLESSEEVERRLNLALEERKKERSILFEKVNDIDTKLKELGDPYDKMKQYGTVMVAATKIIDNYAREEQKHMQRKVFSQTCDSCGQPITEEHKQKVIADADIHLAKYSPLLVEARERYVELAQKHDALREVHTKVTQLKMERVFQQQLVEQANNYILDLEKQLQEATSRTSQELPDNTVLEAEVDEMLWEKERLVKEASDYDVAQQLLKDNGIKTRIIKQYVPIINKIINKYLAAMDFFVNFELDENFNETIKSRYRDDFSYYSFSEGQKFRIDLAIMFTWRAIAKIRNTTNVNLLILDEIFDKSLDTSGTEEFLKIINGLEEGTNTFVISHKTDQLIDQFPNVIKFKMQKNFSTIVEGE